jgi:ABC-type amino acid transport substrate-binding protein
MTLHIIFLVASLFSGFSFADENQAAKAQLASYKWLAEDYPPYNYIDESGRLTGIFTDILLRVYDELELKLAVEDIQVVPWAQLYYQLENHPEFAGFSMVNTVEREKEFTLINAPIFTKISIMVLSEKQKELKSAPHEELTIAVVRADIGKQLLDTRGIKAKQVVTTSAFNMLKLLLHNRVDAIAYEEEVALFQMNKLSLQRKRIVPIYFLDESYSAFIFHKDTPEKVSQLFSEALERLHERGKIEKIRNKYLQ